MTSPANFRPPKTELELRLAVVSFALEMAGKNPELVPWARKLDWWALGSKERHVFAVDGLVVTVGREGAPTPYLRRRVHPGYITEIVAQAVRIAPYGVSLPHGVSVGAAREALRRLCKTVEKEDYVLGHAMRSQVVIKNRVVRVISGNIEIVSVT